jgi:hypothetical protein
MRRAALVVCWALAAVSLSALPSLDEDRAVVVTWLNAKPFVLDRVKFADDTFTRSAIADPPRSLDSALNGLGISLYNLLRNEVFARHGYAFKSDTLRQIFLATEWYTPDSSFTFDKTSALENANIRAIQDLEGRLDYETVEKWLSGLEPFALRFVSWDDLKDTETDSKVRFALNHLNLLPAQVLWNYLLAVRGARPADARFAKLFKAVIPSGVGTDSNEVAVARMSQFDKANIEFLQMRELYERKDAVIYSTPVGIMALPALGAEVYFLRTIPAASGDVHYGGLEMAYLNHPYTDDGHVTSPSTVLPSQASQRVESASGALAQLRAFFENKAYQGYTDTVVFNTSDFVPPPVIVPALKALNLDYIQLLRREIHARHGAIVADPAYAEVFERSSWYKPRLRPDLSTESRLPAGTLSSVEMTNFALLEGEMVYRSLDQGASNFGNGYVLVDMNAAKARWVVFGEIDGRFIRSQDSIPVGKLVEPGQTAVDFDVLVQQIEQRNGVEIYTSFKGGC